MLVEYANKLKYNLFASQSESYPNVPPRIGISALLGTHFLNHLRLIAIQRLGNKHIKYRFSNRVGNTINQYLGLAAIYSPKN